MRWVCSVDWRSRPLPVIYSFGASASDFTCRPIISRLLYTLEESDKDYLLGLSSLRKNPCIIVRTCTCSAAPALLHCLPCYILEELWSFVFELSPEMDLRSMMCESPNAKVDVHTMLSPLKPGKKFDALTLCFPLCMWAATLCDRRPCTAAVPRADALQYTDAILYSVIKMRTLMYIWCTYIHMCKANNSSELECHYQNYFSR